MSEIALKFYTNTLANKSSVADDRVRDFKKKIRTRVSRRRFKQSLRNAVHNYQERYA